MAKLLTLLFEVTELFDMRTRPELILLQKTMVVVEGVARTLDPRLQLWSASEPVVGDGSSNISAPRGSPTTPATDFRHCPLHDSAAAIAARAESASAEFDDINPERRSGSTRGREDDRRCAGRRPARRPSRALDPGARLPRLSLRRAVLSLRGRGTMPAIGSGSRKRRSLWKTNGFFSSSAAGSPPTRASTSSAGCASAAPR